MVAEICRGLDAAGKASFVATLDLQEPVALLRRYEGRGQLDTAPLLTVLLRLRDPEISAAALASPRLVEKRVYYPSNSEGAMNSVEKILVGEAMRLVDPGLLAAVASRMEQAGVDVGCELAYGGRAGEFGTALYALAEQAEAADPARVEACARWARDAREAFIAKAHGKGRTNAAKAQLEAARASRDREFADSLLTLAATKATIRLARAALSMGAQPTAEAAAEAFKSGAPALAIELLGSLPAPLESHGRLELCKSMAWALSSLPESLERERKEGERDKLGARHCQSALSRISGDVGRAVERALESPASGDSELGEAQRVLLASALPLLEYFDQPESWMRRQRESYPDPTPSEIVGLARARKWKTLGARLADAEASGVPATWRAAMERALSAAAVEAARWRRSGSGSVAGMAAPENELAQRWFFKLARKLGQSSLFAKSENSPMRVLRDSGAYSADELSRAEACALAGEEASEMGKASSKAGARARAGSLRM